MKRAFVLILSIVLIISVSGCDSGLLIVGMEIEKYPDRIVYYAGIDEELDLTGGVINYLLKAKIKSTVDMSDDLRMRHINISHNIDFDKPGVYVVELERAGAVCKFPIQVIQKQ